MANIKSAKKRIRVEERNRLRNKAYRSAVRTLIKKAHRAADRYAANPSAESQAELERATAAAHSKIDKAVKRKVLHRNNGARKKARLAKAVKAKTAAAS